MKPSSYSTFGMVGALAAFHLVLTLLFYYIAMPLAVPMGANFPPVALASMQRTLAVIGFLMATGGSLVIFFAFRKLFPQGHAARELCDAIRNPFFILDAGKRLVLCNHPAERLFGISAERDAGRTMDKDVLDVIARGPISPHELDPNGVITRAGRQYLVLDNPLPGTDGGMRHVVMLRDVTHHMQLRDAIAHINESMGVLVSNTQKISSSAASLSGGATRQADSLEAISSSLDEFSQRIQGNTETAQEGTQLAAQAREAAERSGKEIAHALTAMTDVQDAGIRIARIVKLIDDIAFQTNLLALNAAVEAARAGRQGKGFAVVADEVRSLAGRSAKAAKDTASMVEDVTERIGNASAYISKLEEMLRNIVQDAIRMADSSASASATSAEQATAILQVNQELGHMSSVTRTTMAEAEQTAGAVDALVKQVDGIKSMLQDVTVGLGQVPFRDAASQDAPRRPAPPPTIDLGAEPPPALGIGSHGHGASFSRPAAPTPPQPEDDDFVAPFKKMAAQDWDLNAAAAERDDTLANLLRSDGYSQKKYEDILRTGTGASGPARPSAVDGPTEFKTTPDGDRVVKPGQNIHLDDSEFGRY